MLRVASTLGGTLHDACYSLGKWARLHGSETYAGKVSPPFLGFSIPTSPTSDLGPLDLPRLAERFTLSGPRSEVGKPRNVPRGAGSRVGLGRTSKEIGRAHV